MRAVAESLAGRRLSATISFEQAATMTGGMGASRLTTDAGQERTGSDVVRLDHASKSFGNKLAVWDVSFAIPAGEICGLLGPNGAGKTTLFRLLMGILRTTSGSVRIGGLDAFEDRVATKRLIGVVPDEPVFYFYLSGRETLELSAAMHGLDVGAAIDRLQPLIGRLRMGEQLPLFADDYSRGIKKKLALLVATKSLLAETGALWVALSWPHSLEGLLKAKARLWTIVSSAVVGLVLCATVWTFPSSWGGIVLVGVGWTVFAQSKASRTVTLLRAADAAGVADTVPAGRRWATQLGTVPFFVGVVTGQWPLAMVGLVYAHATAAAMWENFRARLPYLLDPWSEQTPRPPTLMQAMISISAFVEVSAVLVGIVSMALGREQAAAGRAIAYGAAALIVSIFVARFLLRRGVRLSDMWFWRAAATPRLLSVSLAYGAGTGALLGSAGCAYLAFLHRIPGVGEAVRHADALLSAVPHIRQSLFVLAVFFAPPAEEFLFRGLLYRALDRQWRDWRAVAGSAAFFASWHPVRSWLPVGLLGAANAVLFKRTGRLAAPVVAHATYNAVVVGWTFGWL